MQTFVPESTAELCARVLDRQRLGKQRVEVLQILRANLGVTKGWVNHPAARMWRGHEDGLAHYGLAMCAEWISRGYKDTCTEKILELAPAAAPDYPEWWGGEEMMVSHRSNLIRKFPEFYLPLWPGTSPNLEYVWPN